MTTKIKIELSKIMSYDYKASIQYIKIASQFAVANNVNLTELQHVFSLPSNSQVPDNKKLPLGKILDFWHQAAELTSDKAFGLHAGVNCHLSSYGIFAHVLMNCDHVYNAIRLTNQYSYLLNEAFENTLTTKQEITIYTLEFLLPHVAAPQIVEFHFASMVQMGKQIVARKDSDKVHPVRIEFCHAPLTTLEEYKRIFECDVVFEQTENRMISLQEALLTPTNAPNKGLYHHLLKQVDAIFQANLNQKCHSRKVSDYLKSEKEWVQWPTLEETADALGTSPSTLKRKLKHEGGSFQEIFDGIRYQRARHILRSNKYTVSEVAYAMGFSCAASFGRSFKRWSGMPPSEFMR